MNNNDLPNHIGIIMDGNRRWAKSKMLPIKLGHKEGAKTLEKIVKYANKIGIKYITVFAFSTENWKRDKDEVDALMSLLKYYLEDFANKADSENIRVKVIGNLKELSEDLQKSIEKVVNKTSSNTGTVFSIALNYGGRDEIVNAVKSISTKVRENKLNIEDINNEVIEENLYTKDIPDVDLMIRTSGELRTSGFLMWKLVYAEFLFLDKLWPDFSETDLDESIEVYNKRNRRFGAK
ncbi:MAG: isoprenyl transferase [Clostridia bacterium]|jgi:undecaprenyl diphosphate synthase|nr:isoprenyl transferase [Clostridia bacterium]